MKSKLFRSGWVMVAIALFVFPGHLFAATTDKDFTLDDGIGDSPRVILRDAGNRTLTLQKMDAGEANIVNDEGAINLKPSADTDDYLQFLTTGNASYLHWLGVLTYTNAPGLRVNPTTGELEYRDEDSAFWVAIDDISGGATLFGGLLDTVFTNPAAGDVVYFDGTDWVNLATGIAGQILAVNAGANAPEWIDVAAGNLAGLSDTIFTGIARGDILYYNGTAWVNLGPGTSGQVLQTGGPAADPSWLTITGTIADGTVANNTLRWDGTGWVESGALTNDGINITTAGDIAVSGGDIASTAALTITPNAGANLNVVLSTTGDFIVNTNDLVVDTNTGNVGIGTASPADLLHLKGVLDNDGVRGTLRIERHDNPLSYMLIDDNEIDAAVDRRLNLNLNSSGDISLVGGGGDVGIGTTTPDARLEVDIDIGENRIGLFVDQGDTTYNPTALEIRNAGLGNSLLIDINKFVVTGAGSVGIGTAIPTSRLQVVGLPTYADNAAAIAAGLTAGAFYHAGDGIVRVVF